jgi:D-glycero-alpha-D-manno-heptose-7-phosphate kinase
VIISRTPLRISLGGGGTDLPSYYRQSQDGFVVAGAISRHVYIAVNEHFEDDLLLKYSQLERVSRADEVKHPLLREALRMHGIQRHLEISSMADLPARTGLGSSGAFTVGLIKALKAYLREVASNQDIAAQACRIEIDILGEPVGKQDQFISAIGGVTAFRFQTDDSVELMPVQMSEEDRDRLEENLLLFYTGRTRSAGRQLRAQDHKIRVGESDIHSNLDEVRRIGLESFKALTAGDFEWFSNLMLEQWELKKARSADSTDGDIDRWITAGLDSGASGGKLVGAGGGGFLLFYAENKSGLRQAMAELGLREIRFGFDYEGSKLIVG